jgi:hypothetical protein
MESVVRFEPNVSIRFLAEELRRYGIKTNSKNDRGKTIFYQSAHIVMTFDKAGDGGLVYPSYTLVSFKDLFKIIGKNPNGVDDQDIVRVWYIAEKLEKRRILTIQGTGTKLLGEDDRPDLPDVYANLHHIHRNDLERDSYVYKSKFATNKAYKTKCGTSLIGVADYFLLG